MYLYKIPASACQLGVVNMTLSFFFYSFASKVRQKVATRSTDSTLRHSSIYNQIFVALSFCNIGPESSKTTNRRGLFLLYS